MPDDGHTDYENMKRRVASYSMGICRAIVELRGKDALVEVIKKAAVDSGANKIRDYLPSGTSPITALGQLLEGMLAEFETPGVTHQITPDSYEVTNLDCGCLPPFISQAINFEFTPEEARRYACMRCLPSYKAAAEGLDIGFQGKLTPNGCTMRFYEKKSS